MNMKVLQKMVMVFFMYGVCCICHARESVVVRESGFVAKNIAFQEEGMYVGFETTPAGCAGSFKGFHAFISNELEEFTDYVIMMKVSRATGKTVAISYVDQGDCSVTAGIGSLIRIIAVE